MPQQSHGASPLNILEIEDPGLQEAYDVEFWFALMILLRGPDPLRGPMREEYWTGCRCINLHL